MTQTDILFCIMLELKIKKREISENLKKLRKNGLLPAVFYGKKEKTMPISLQARDFKKIWKKAGESTVVILSGVGDPKEALIHSIDFDPVLDIPRHIDFYVIEVGAKVQVNVPLEFIGESRAVKELGGNLVKVLHSIEIKVSTKDLPQHIEADISGLVDFTCKITAKDIKLPKSAELVTKSDEVIALVAEISEEKEEDTAAPDLDSIEVEKKGKEEVAEDGSETVKDKKKEK